MIISIQFRSAYSIENVLLPRSVFIDRNKDEVQGVFLLGSRPIALARSRQTCSKRATRIVKHTNAFVSGTMERPRPVTSY